MLLRKSDKKRHPFFYGAILLICYFVLLFCLCNSIGCTSAQKSPGTDYNKDIIDVIDSGILKPVQGESESVQGNKLKALTILKGSLLTAQARAEPEKKTTLDKIFNIGILFIIILAIGMVYKVFRLIDF